VWGCREQGAGVVSGERSLQTPLQLPLLLLYSITGLTKSSSVKLSDISV